jgi:phosphohistidine phosphatase SixA
MKNREGFVAYAAMKMAQAKTDDDQRAGHAKACRLTAEALADELGLKAEEAQETKGYSGDVDRVSQLQARVEELEGAHAALTGESARLAELNVELHKRAVDLEAQLEQATAPAAKRGR